MLYRIRKWISLCLAVVISVCSVNYFFFTSHAKTNSSIFDEMLARAEAIVNYEWTPSQDIDVWNENPYNGKMYFPAGETVIGMPYTLFSWEFGFDSLLSLAQYKTKVAVNYSTTAYCSSMGANRTGPVYGSCCATFVSEVLGGSFVSEGNPRYDNCSGIENSKYGTTYYNVRMEDLQPGDAVINTSRGHVIWVGAVNDDSVTIYEQTPPVARKVVVPKTSITSEGYMNYGGKAYNIVTKSNELLGSYDDQYDRSDKYPVPIKAYTINTGKTIVYDSIEGNSKANKIYDTDLCTITKLYKNGWCYVYFPLDAGGTDSGYVRTSVFFDFESQGSKLNAKERITAYRRSDLGTFLGVINNTSEVFLISETYDSLHILYPIVPGEFELGWIQKDDADKLQPITVYSPGDINGDGSVNNKDLTRLMKYLSGEDVLVIEDVIDINGDGSINNKDLARLMKYLAGEDVIISA